MGLPGLLLDDGGAGTGRLFFCVIRRDGGVGDRRDALGVASLADVAGNVFPLHAPTSILRPVQKLAETGAEAISGLEILPYGLSILPPIIRGKERSAWGSQAAGSRMKDYVVRPYHLTPGPSGFLDEIDKGVGLDYVDDQARMRGIEAHS